MEQAPYAIQIAQATAALESKKSTVAFGNIITTAILEQVTIARENNDLRTATVGILLAEVFQEAIPPLLHQVQQQTLVVTTLLRDHAEVLRHTGTITTSYQVKP